MEFIGCYSAQRVVVVYCQLSLKQPVAEKVKQLLSAADSRFDVIQGCPLVLMPNKIIPPLAPPPPTPPSEQALRQMQHMLRANQRDGSSGGVMSADPGQGFGESRSCVRPACSLVLSLAAYGNSNVKRRILRCRRSRRLFVAL